MEQRPALQNIMTKKKRKDAARCRDSEGKWTQAVAAECAREVRNTFRKNNSGNARIRLTRNTARLICGKKWGEVGISRVNWSWVGYPVAIRKTGQSFFEKQGKRGDLGLQIPSFRSATARPRVE